MIQSASKYSKEAKWGFFIAAVFVLSINAQYRLSVAGFLVHPYLVFLPVALFFTKINVLAVPKTILNPLLLFFLFFTLGSLQNNNPLSELTKVAAAFLTFLFFVHVVKNEFDFRLLSWGFLVVAVVIGVWGFFVGEDVGEEGARLAGINVLEGIGNKNAQSLFTLPGLFLALTILRQYFTNKKYFVASMLLMAIFFITVQIFLSANRSGWLGLVIVFIAFLFYSGAKKGTLIIGGALVIFSYVAINQYASDIFERKKEQTLGSYGSDLGRQHLIIQSLLIGLENPILGIGYENLRVELARKLGLNRIGVFNIDTHFLLGYIFGATGVFSLIFFLAFLAGLFRRVNLPVKDRRELTKARILMFFFVVLFIIRSLFTREILYSPTFIGALGLIYGYYLMVARHAVAVAQPKRNA